MEHRTRGLRVPAIMLLAALAAVILAACGAGSSPSATSLLQQTFAGAHRVSSGRLDLSLTIDPAGSSTVAGPVHLSFDGPFEAGGSGQVPRFDLTARLTVRRRTGSLGIISTANAGYVTVQGTGYRMPQATFRQLESTFARIGASPQAGAVPASSELSKLGIKPLHWLTNPTVAGTQNVSGTATTHIHAGINVPALLADVSAFLRMAATSGVSGSRAFAGGISASTRAKIAREIRNPTFDLWTANSDKTVRKLSINFSLPVTERSSTQLGDPRAVAVGLVFRYTNLGQQQTITAPTTVRPFSEFRSRARALLKALTGR